MVDARSNHRANLDAAAARLRLSSRETRKRDIPWIGTDRAYEINQMAWEHFTTPVAAEFARSHLEGRRGIDLVALQAFSGGAPIVGYARARWTTLVDRLRDNGVSDDELLGTNLAQLTRGGRLVDTYRGRIMVPVTSSAGWINGFIGGNATAGEQAPKYRNPARTVTFNKSMILYRPTHQGLAADANVVVVEGVLDALAIAAAAARAGEMDRFAPCTTNEAAVSHEQVCRVLALHGRPPVISLNGDGAGVEGARRWLTALCLDGGRPALVTTLPAGSDPAGWLAAQGASGLAAFDRRGSGGTDEHGVRPSLPGRELVRLLAEHHLQPVRAVLTKVVPLAAQLPPEAATELLQDAEQEVTRLGWNPSGSFTRALTKAFAGVAGTSYRPDPQAAATRPAYEGSPMKTDNARPRQMGLAAEHLGAAAHQAEASSLGDLTSPWHDIAGQIRLIASDVSPVGEHERVTPLPLGVREHLDAALSALDSIPAGQGPPELMVWAWRVADIRSLVVTWTGVQSRPPQP